MTETLSRRRALGAASAFVLASLEGRATGLPRELVPESPPGPVFGQGLLIQLQVQDLDRSIAFYTRGLGFRVAERRDDLQFVHLDCGVAGLQIGLSAGGSQAPAAGSVVLNFNVRGDVERVRAALEKEGVRFTGPTQVIEGKVRLAPFLDPDGYRLRLASDDPPRG